jgi:TetR/AcrR family transcriptional repressor of mexJK operon
MDKFNAVARPDDENRKEFNDLPASAQAADATDASDAASQAKSAGRPRAADQEARLQELLFTAGTLFLDKGYSKVSLEMIAREAHVAVRTIYVKFGGKAGLLHAVLIHHRERFFPDLATMDNDPRPLRAVVGDFARRIWQLVNNPQALAMQRMVIAEAKTTPELAETFYRGGPSLTRAMLQRYFSRPDVQAQLRPDVPLDMLPGHLIGCVIGDAIRHYLFDLPEPEFDAEQERALAIRLEMFYRAVLINP